jgi:glycosyltransferase involved in cell wall biosynthesis
MDLSLYWQGAAPAHVGALLEALVALPEAEDVPEGRVLLCPDATVLAPPADDGAALVAFVGATGRLDTPAGRAQLTERLGPWTARGAVLLAPNRRTADDVAALLGVPAARVHAVALPLPADRRPAAPATPGADIVVLDDGLVPGTVDALLRAAALVRRFGTDARLVLPAGVADGIGRPGSLAGGHDLVGGRDVVCVPDWRDAVDGAGALLLTAVDRDRGWTLREALATGRPVVAAGGPALAGHLGALGAPAYPFDGDLVRMAEALHAALRGDRGAAVGPAARAAVLAETPETAARALLGALSAAVAPPAAPAIVAGPDGPRDGLAIGVINPHPSAGGGERFLRQLLAALAAHPSRPRITLVCQEDPARTFDAGLDDLRAAGVEVHQAPADRLVEVFAQRTADRDVAYCPWPQLAWPPEVDGPLVCTFHDVNWRRFDVMSAEQKQLLDAQSPLWLQRCAAVVHSSRFIADEVAELFGPDYPAHVIPLTADLGGAPIGDEERAALRRRHALPERFVFSPAGRHLHKNYAVLNAACALLREQGRPVPVVATGAATDRYHGPDLVGLGYVSARDISVLYDLCCGVVQTTLYEAGSWPMIEAMDARRPVACSRIPSIVEQVDRVGLEARLFDPTDIAAVADALAALHAGGADADVLERNRERVRALEWSAVADAYLRVLQAAAAGTPAIYAPQPC